MNMEVNKKKKLIIGGICLVTIIGVLIIIYTIFMPKGQEGAKNIGVEVVYADKTTKTVEINTDEEFLRGALEQENLIEGTEGDFGLFVLTVDGVTVNDDNQEWWCFTKSKEMLMTSVDQTPIADGDHFEIVLTVGY